MVFKREEKQERTKEASRMCSLLTEGERRKFKGIEDCLKALVCDAHGLKLTETEIKKALCPTQEIARAFYESIEKLGNAYREIIEQYLDPVEIKGLYAEFFEHLHSVKEILKRAY